jgi:2-haloacid dehalogenase
VAGVQAVVFDLGGVVIDLNPEHLYRSLILDPDDRQAFLTEVCTWEWHRQHDAGRPMAETIPELASRHPHLADLIGAWSERYVDMVSGTVPGMAELVARVRAHVPTYALTACDLRGGSFRSRSSRATEARGNATRSRC